MIDLSRKRTMASLDEMSEGGEDDRPFEIPTTGPSPLEQFQVAREQRRGGRGAAAAGADVSRGSGAAVL